MSLRPALIVLAMLGVTACVPVTRAQRGIDDLVSRPSQRSGSQSLGGRFTRGNTAPMDTSRRNVATLGEQPYTFRGMNSASPLTRSLSTARLGLRGSARFGIGSSDLFSRIGRTGRGLIAGFHSPRVIRPYYPALRGMPLPAIDGHTFTSRPATTRFHDLFGLVPTEPEPEATSVGTVAERLDARTDARVAVARKKGLALFKKATIEARELDAVTGDARYPNCRDCGENLSLAVQQLALVRTLDSEGSLAPLLLVHAYLEQERPMAAAGQLLVAWRRNTELLADRHDLDQYFGDVAGEAERSEYLEVQAERYLHIAALSPALPTTHALEAYCAWRLGDVLRAREAAERAIQLAQLTQGDGDPERNAALLSFTSAVVDAIHATGP